jgi:hypothetical protein
MDVRTCERAKVRKCESAEEWVSLNWPRRMSPRFPSAKDAEPTRRQFVHTKTATQQGVPKYDLPPSTLAQSETPKVRSKSGAHFQWTSQPPKAGFRYVEMPFGLQVSQLSLKDTTMTGTGPLNLQSMERGVLIDI